MEEKKLYKNYSFIVKGHIYPQQTELPPALPQEPDFDETEISQKPLADDEPVDTLVENLERDITEVWSYRNMFPDAESLGLDNDKVAFLFIIELKFKVRARH